MLCARAAVFITAAKAQSKELVGRRLNRQIEIGQYPFEQNAFAIVALIAESCANALQNELGSSVKRNPEGCHPAEAPR